MNSALIEGAVNGDKHQLRILLEQHDGAIGALQESTGTIASNTDAAAPVNPVPALAQLQVVKGAAGLLHALITNPQFLRSTTPGQVKGNLARTPLTHILSYSTDPTFPRATTTKLPPGVQTHYLIPASSPVYFRIQSSTDGVNFNSVQQSGPHSA